jgi:hypothetical protein
LPTVDWCVVVIVVVLVVFFVVIIIVAIVIVVVDDVLVTHQMQKILVEVASSHTPKPSLLSYPTPPIVSNS